MGLFDRVVNSNWLIAIIFLLVLVASVPRIFQHTYDSPQYAYHPPFGSIQTVTGMGEDISHKGRINPIGGLKMLSGPMVLLAMYFIPTLLAILTIRWLRRPWSNGSSAVLSSVINVFVILLTFFVGLVFVGLLWTVSQFLIAVGSNLAN